MNIKKNKFLVCFFVLVLFIGGIFCFKNPSLLQKYINKIDFINYKKTVDYLGKKYSHTFSEKHHNVYGSLNTFKIINTNLNKKEIFFLENNYQNNLSMIKDFNIKNILFFKVLNMESQLKNSKYSLQILQNMYKYPWNNISKIYIRNIMKKDCVNDQKDFVYLNDSISFS